jgi:hypothetical protein
MLRKSELCEFWGQKTGKWVSRTVLCRYATKIRSHSKKKTWYSSQAGTERVQKLRVEYWEKIRNIEVQNLVFLDETGMMLGLARSLSVGDKSRRNQTILSRSESHSHWRN